MKKFLITVFSAMFLLSGVCAFADNIGAGLGRVALKGKKGLGFELLGTCLNACCYSQFFAITSGTSGYQEGAKIGNCDDIHQFVASNMDGLAADIARGNGEYLDTLGTILKVEDRAAFNAKMKSQFRNIYTSYGLTSDQVTENILSAANM